jgi:hypothetical protein
VNRHGPLGMTADDGELEKDGEVDALENNHGSAFGLGS